MSQPIDEKKLREYYEVSLELVRQCGPLFMEGFRKPKLEFQTKSAIYDQVTYYDKQIESVLSEGLLKAFPESKIIGEEALADSQSHGELTDAPTWIIDPIDGTNNYIRKIPHCCISVGLAINKQLVAGVIYNPAQNELYSAWQGHGAFLNGQPIHANDIKTMDQAVVALETSLMVFPKRRGSKMKRFYKLTSQANGSRSFGSAALGLCYVAVGQCDVYHVEHLKPWDLAAGVAILREAGGTVVHTSGGAYDVMHPDCVCASTEELARNVVRLIEEADQLTCLTFE
ncbi:inositol monophosphatase ttx-7 [Drosophila bipectinata]|uniref:inositol monophosphatase ttx-7 n=1 Tax=Drosophila bipectinata TaxID=42026 RepID=UPI001C89E8C7|nr:inositol monophosphatase ttx-7 [Drosophila bipectinata]